MGIVEFLEARITDDEALAKSASPGPWIWLGDAREDESFLYDAAGENVLGAYGLHTEGFLERSAENAGHISRHDPSRVLAECAAKRKLVEMHITCDDVSYGDASTCPEIRTIAAVYTDHPEYLQEWAQ